MPRILEIKMIDNEPWIRLEIMNNEGSVHVLTPQELDDTKRSAVRDFLNYQFESWRDQYE